MALAFQYRSLQESKKAPARVALFPGAWNPPTVAHVAIAKAALDRADEIVWLLPRAFPHKSFEDAAPEDRLWMLCRIAGSEPGFSVAQTTGGLFIEMAEEVREFFGPDTEISLLCGKDAAERIAQWNYGRSGVFEDMIDRYPLLVAGRAGEYLPARRHKERVLPLPMPASFDEVSSSEVRARIRRGEPWRALVPPAIADRVAAIYG